jgi:hypothetical protein
LLAPDEKTVEVEPTLRRDLLAGAGLYSDCATDDARLTLAFSKSFRNHCAAVMLWYCWYNFGRIHKSLRVTPAMQNGIADHVWSVRELLGAACPPLSTRFGQERHQSGPRLSLGYKMAA